MNPLMPVVFLSHGSPMLALEEEPTTRFLRDLSSRTQKPNAIVVASAHWETNDPMLTGAEHPETIHDFSGFPKELYALRYPAPGNPQLAERIRVLLTQAGFKPGIDQIRGFDHGVWDPLLVIYPGADIPVIELSVQPGHDARWHYEIGQALAPLRSENILIIGSGNLTHNLREAFRGHHLETPSWVTAFADWVADRIEQNDIDALLNWDREGPHAMQNHPTPEHFLPFFVALGAGGDARPVQRLNKVTAMGALAMDVYLWNGAS